MSYSMKTADIDFKFAFWWSFCHNLFVSSIFIDITKNNEKLAFCPKSKVSYKLGFFY